jgi:hypothetical protein
MVRRTAALAVAFSLLFLLPVSLAACPLVGAAPGDCNCRSMVPHTNTLTAPAQTTLANVGCLCPGTNSAPVQAAQNKGATPVAFVPASVAFVSGAPATASALLLRGRPFESPPPFAGQALLCVFRI